MERKKVQASVSVREKEKVIGERERICVSNVCGGVNRYSKMSFYIYESVYVLVFYAPAISLFLSNFFRSLSLSVLDYKTHSRYHSVAYSSLTFY